MKKLRSISLISYRNIMTIMLLCGSIFFLISCNDSEPVQPEGNDDIQVEATYPSVEQNSYPSEQNSYPSPNSSPTNINAYPDPNNTAVEVVENDRLNELDGKLLYQSDHTGSFQIYVQEDDMSPIHLSAGLPVAVEGVWSPDGSKIAYATTGADSTNYVIQVMDADGNNKYTPLADQPRLNWRPIWSPDGNQLLFLSNRDENFEIYKMNIDGSNLINLTNNAATDLDPDWSEVTNKLIFVSNRDGGDAIYLMNPDGSQVEQLLANEGRVFYPRWSPDGQLIAFVSDIDTTKDIYVINADGSNLRMVTDRIGDNTMPEWLDNERLLFSGDLGDETWDLYKINIDGSNLIQLTGPESPRTYSERYPRWMP